MFRVSCGSSGKENAFLLVSEDFFGVLMISTHVLPIFSSIVSHPSPPAIRT